MTECASGDCGEKYYAVWGKYGTPRKRDVEAIRKSSPKPVANFFELYYFVAKIIYSNSDKALMFRGQCDDVTVEGATTIKPRIYRPEGKKQLEVTDIEARFNKLKCAARKLTGELKGLRKLGVDSIGKKSEVRWSILQHYGICDTPLLDVTTSLHVAVSFACAEQEANSDRKAAYVYVLDVSTGPQHVKPDGGFAVLDLSKKCPPIARRPALQSGYMIGGTEPSGWSPSNSQRPPFDFASRLVTKFKLCPGTFLDDSIYQPLSGKALYPPEDKNFSERLENVRQQLAKWDEVQ